MPKSKLTLIVDGNWLLMSRLSVLNNRFADDYELNQELKLLMIKSINIVLKNFPDIDNVIFVADGGSWRNNLEIPDYLIKECEEDGVPVGYKENRVKSDDINWELLFKSYDEFITNLKECGITACQENNVEGDDWCYHWSTLLNSQETNCIIWTKDNDLKQLVHIDSNKCFTVWWNADNGLYIEDFPEENFNFLFNTEFNINEDLLEHIKAKSKEVFKINKNDIIIDKIIRGDAGDNIYPILVKKSKARKYRVSAKELDLSLDYKNENAVHNYIYNLINSKKYAGSINKSLENIEDHFNFNRKLVVLEKESYPQEILDIFNQYNDYTVSKDTSLAENKIQAESNKLKGILDII
jgi:5'-3' exonuclease